MKKVFDNIKKSVFALTVSSVLFAGCNVGLGDAVDTTGPEVSITSPDFMANVPTAFVAKGTATDNEAVTKLTITFEDTVWTYKDGKWDREGASFANGEWTVNVSLPESASGEYVLKVSATDSFGNSGKNSFSSRTVVYDTKPPVVTVTNPTKLYKDSSEISSVLSSDDYKDFTYISEYLNGEVAIQGYQEEDFNLAELIVRITDKDGNEYFNQTLKSETDNLRNWNVTVPASSLPTEKTFLQILTKSKDAANNEESEKPNGFFCWWPSADKPWTETAKIEETSTIPQNSEAQYYPGYKFQGQCFDDDGIKSVSVKLYKNETEEVGSYDYTKGENDETSTFIPWFVQLPAETGTLKIVATCTDINDVVSETVSGYMGVMDITTPQLQITDPSQTKSLFGDENANVTIKGTAVDDSGVKELKMVWLKNESDLLSYTDASYSGWNFTSDSEDASKNKRWILPLGNGSREGGSVIKYDFSKTLNLFTDLGIDGETNKLTNQTFVFRVVDSSDRTNTLVYAVQGDIKKPEISITKVYVKYSESDIKEYNPDYASSLPTFGGGTTVKVTGTWSDDSTSVWSDKTRVKGSIKIEGLTNATVTANDDGTWETSYSANAATGGLSVKATIKDLAGSEAVAKATYAINTDEAAFEKITAENADGTFGVGAKITILMKFTKAVTVEGNPVLVLNNGKTVGLTSGNGEKIHKFEYTVEANDDTTALNVTSISENCIWKDASSNTNVAVAISETNDLKFNKNIAIVTKAPEVKSVSLNEAGDELSVEFSSAIYKNTGNIEIEQPNVTNAPAVLTTAEYNRLKSSISSYYEKTTNGCDSKGNADLTTKYVLKYEYNSNNTALVNAYKNSGATKITMSVKSSNVTVDSTDKNILKIKLTGTNALPCKGTSYSVKIPAKLVSDVIGNDNAEDTKTVTLGGVEKPVVRVSKGSSSFNTDKLTATQPLTSAFKIDCETPNATVKYGISSRQYSYEYHDKTTDDYYKEKSAARGYDNDIYASMDLGTGSNGVAESAPLPKQGTAPEAPASFDKTYSGEVSIGSSEWKFGEKFFIGAEATAESSSEKAYATANRSLFVFQGKTDNDDQRIWLRGGDSETGDVLTAGFPLSWNMTDSNGVALLTKDGDYWYYISWEISTTAYVGVMIGEPEASGEKVVQEEGTTTFGVNAWVPFKAWYCIYPGESRIVETDRYEYVYGKQRDWFKWNWQNGSGGGDGESQRDKDLKKMTIASTYEASATKDDGITLATPLNCTDEWQRVCINKWDDNNANTNGQYLIFNVEKTGDGAYLDVWVYPNGNKVTFGKVDVSENGTVKMQISDAASNGWKWDEIYIGGKNINVNGVKLYQPTSSTVPVPNASVLTAGAKIKVTTNSDVDSIVDYPGFSVGKQWQNAAKNTTYTFTLTQEDVDSLKGWGYVYSLGIGIDKVETPVHTYEWTKLSSVAAGELIQFTVSESDGLVSDSECFVMFDGHKLNVTNGVAEYEFTSSDVSNPWKYTNSSPEIYSYGVSIMGQSVKSPYHKAEFSGANWYPGFTLTVEFEKDPEFDIENPALIFSDSSDKVVMTPEQLSAKKYDLGQTTRGGMTSVTGYGLIITKIYVDGVVKYPAP